MCGDHTPLHASSINTCACGILNMEYYCWRTQCRPVILKVKLDLNMDRELLNGPSMWRSFIRRHEILLTTATLYRNCSWCCNSPGTKRLGGFPRNYKHSLVKFIAHTCQSGLVAISECTQIWALPGIHVTNSYYPPVSIAVNTITLQVAISPQPHILEKLI